MFNSPRKAKRLYFDVIPRAADDYLTHLAKFPEQEPAEQLMNPVWHIHGGSAPREQDLLRVSEQDLGAAVAPHSHNDQADRALAERLAAAPQPRRPAALDSRRC